MKRAPRISLLCIGTELLRGQLNTHESKISLALSGHGLPLWRSLTLPDDPKLIAREIREALSEGQAALVCGGLGPTFDDLTREAASLALEKPLVYRPELYSAILRKLSRHAFPVAEENRRQAFVLEGAQVIENERGSAPGQLLAFGRAGSKLLALLPGPYSEMWPMFESVVLPRLLKTYGPQPCSQVAVHMSGIPESLADEKLSGLTRRPKPGEDFTILSGPGQVDFYARVRTRSRELARKKAAALRKRIHEAVGRHIFGEDGETLESAVGRILRKGRLTLAVAESCTAGLLGARLTEVPGSSKYFLGGVLAYSDELKRRALGVPKELLSRHGAVSAECAQAMALGARRLARASIGLSITGIAGPGGGGPEKPVGLVYIGISGPGSQQGGARYLFSGDRQYVRRRAVTAALDLLRLTVGRRT